MHWTQVAKDDWPSIYFSPQEVACRRTGLVMLTADSRAALKKLDALRRAMGHPLLLTSGYRSPAHNAAVGGAKGSYHMKGTAFDINMSNVDPHRCEEEARRVGFTGIGIYARSGFLHVDTRDGYWRGVQQGKEFPRRSFNRFATETPATPVVDAAKEAAPVIGIGGMIEAAVAQAEPVLREAAPGLPENIQGYIITAAGLLALALIGFRVYKNWKAKRAEGGEE
jgi:hypothetical protein